MYNPVLVEMLVLINVQEILAEAEHNRVARQASTRRPSQLVTLINRLHGLAFGIDHPQQCVHPALAFPAANPPECGHVACRVGVDRVPSTYLLPGAGSP